MHTMVLKIVINRHVGPNLILKKGEIFFLIHFNLLWCGVKMFMWARLCESAHIPIQKHGTGPVQTHINMGLD